MYIFAFVNLSEWSGACVWMLEKTIRECASGAGCKSFRRGRRALRVRVLEKRSMGKEVVRR